jgi:DNA-binding HxlR family transcriptional regulator
MVRRFFTAGKKEICEKNNPRNQTEPEKKLLVLEFFMGQKDDRTSNWIARKQTKFNKITNDKVTALLDAMVIDALLVRKEIPDGTDKLKVLYNISPDGRKAIETIKKLKDEDHPIVKLDFFRLLD